jgi:hypothetical protein
MSRRMSIFNVIKRCNISAAGGTENSTEKLTTTGITNPNYHILCTCLCEILSDFAILTLIMSAEYFQVQCYIC